jgi:hypothetical protein
MVWLPTNWVRASRHRPPHDDGRIWLGGGRDDNDSNDANDSNDSCVFSLFGGSLLRLRKGREEERAGLEMICSGVWRFAFPDND